MLGFPAHPCAWRQLLQPHSSSLCHCCPCVCFVPRGLPKIPAGMGVTKGDGDILGEERCFASLILCPRKGMDCAPTHHWAGEELCDSSHIPTQGRRMGRFSSPSRGTHSDPLLTGMGAANRICAGGNTAGMGRDRNKGENTQREAKPERREICAETAREE